MNKDKAIQLLERLQDPEPYEPMLTKDAYDAIQMAIDALSADGDTISRQAAIDALDEQIEQCDKALSAFDISMKDAYAVKVERASLVAFRETLEYMPSAQPEQQWIPCSERLPENRLYVLVTYKYEYGLIDHGITWYGQAEEKWDTSREVIAWMPLPEPWRGDSICK